MPHAYFSLSQIWFLGGKHLVHIRNRFHSNAVIYFSYNSCYYIDYLVVTASTRAHLKEKKKIYRNIQRESKNGFFFSLFNFVFVCALLFGGLRSFCVARILPDHGFNVSSWLLMEETIRRVKQHLLKLKHREISVPCSLKRDNALIYKHFNLFDDIMHVLCINRIDARFE